MNNTMVREIRGEKINPKSSFKIRARKIRGSGNDTSKYGMFQNPILQQSQPFCFRNAASRSAPLQNNRQSYNFNIYLSIVNEKTNYSGLNSNRNSPNNLTWS